MIQRDNRNRLKSIHYDYYFICNVKKSNDARWGRHLTGCFLLFVNSREYGTDYLHLLKWLKGAKNVPNKKYNKINEKK